MDMIEKRDIVHNAIDPVHALGIAIPKVALCVLALLLAWKKRQAKL